MDINSMLGVRESYQAPTALMKVLLDDEQRPAFVQEYRDGLPDLEHEHLREYFMENQSDRKGDKQDYTPDAIGEIITGILGPRDCVLDIAGGIGGLTIHQWGANHGGIYVVEEISSASLPFLLLNLLARQIDAVVVNGDSLERTAKSVYRVAGNSLHVLPKTSETLKEYELRGGLMSYDAVISNPPYSLDWSMDKSLAIDGYPLAPKSKADWQFVLEGIDQLNDNGTAVYVLPHGVLFRGSAEAKIRQRVIEEGHLDAVIGLPDKLFDVTGIPVCLLVLKKHRAATDTLFIDASQDFEKAKNKNILKPEHVKRVVETYQAREDVDRYAHVATFEEMRDNEFNLNIPRYVDTFVPEPVPTLTEIMNDMSEIDAQIAHNEQELATQFSQLKARTPEAQAELDRFVKFFGKRAKHKREEQLTLL